MILPVFWFKIYFYFQVLLLGFFSKSMSKNLLLKPTLLKLGVFALSALICVGTVNVCSASSRYKTTITAVSSDEIRLGGDRSKIGETPVIKQKLIIGSFKKGETFNKAAKRAGLSAKEIHQIQQILADKLDYSRLRPGDSFRILLSDEGENSKVNALQFKTKNHGNLALYRNQNNNKFYSESEIAPQPATAFRRFPINGEIKVNSAFNPSRRHPVTGLIRPHKGVDFKASIGTPVYAPADGTVYFSGYQRAAGNYIIIEHNNGYKTVYMHLSKRHVKKGQKVKLGQLIAKSGNTGRTSGPHLHYEIHVNNRPVDPMKVNLPSAPSKKPLLSQKEQKAFAKTVKKYKADMKSLALIYMPNTEISVN